MTTKRIEEILNQDIRTMTLEDLKILPRIRTFGDPEIIFDSLVILPTEDTHESNFSCIDYVACIGFHPVGLLTGGSSDVLHINGIGGYGEFNGSIPDTIPVISWNMDCLPVSKLLRLFTFGHDLCVKDFGLSSFSVYARKQTRS